MQFVRCIHLCYIFTEFCHQTHLNVRVEAGSGLTPDMTPADVLVQNWVGGNPAAFDLDSQ